MINDVSTIIATIGCFTVTPRLIATREKTFNKVNVMGPKLKSLPKDGRLQAIASSEIYPFHHLLLHRGPG